MASKSSCAVCGRHSKWVVEGKGYCGYHAKKKDQPYSLFSPLTIKLYGERIVREFFARWKLEGMSATKDNY